MKNILLYFFLTTTFFSACKKDDSSLFNKSPDQRLNEALTAYESQLVSATNGWKGLIYPKSGGVYTFYFKFDESNRVQMLSGFDSVSAVTLKESSYRLKALQQPSLLFDTYSYLHVLADPDPSANGGITGAGLQSDFEFYFDSSAADTIHLVGRYNGSKATLIKATPEEAAGFANGQLAAGFVVNKILTYFKRFSTSSGSVDFHLDPSAGTISLPDATGNLLDTTLTAHYYMTLNGINFSKPLVYRNQNITDISNINYNASNQTISCTVNNAAATISNVTVPAKVDVNAPKRWWNYKAATNDFWFSFSGFRVNGVDNAFRLDTLTSQNFPYYFWIYWPKYQSAYDLSGPVFVDTSNSLTIEYTSFPNPPAFTSDGRAVFTELDTYGTYPTMGGAASTSQLFYNSRGYYFVQTSESTYDMVSALDEKSWISWQ